MSARQRNDALTENMRAPATRRYLLRAGYALCVFLGVTAAIAGLRKNADEAFLDRYIQLVTPMLFVWCIGFVVALIIGLRTDFTNRGRSPNQERANPNPSSH